MSVPYKEIVLDKPRKIKFNMSALLTAQVLTGKKVMDIVGDIIMCDAETISKLCYAGLKHEDKSLTYDRTVELIDEHYEDVSELIRDVVDAFSAATGRKIKPVEEEEETEQTDPNAQGPAGT